MKDRYTDRRMYFEELAQTSREYILKYISTFVTTEPDYRIMEIGCGEGGNLVPFAEIGCKVCGIDLSMGKIANARKFLTRMDSKENSSALTLSDVISSHISGCMMSSSCMML